MRVAGREVSPRSHVRWARRWEGENDVVSGQCKRLLESSHAGPLRVLHSLALVMGCLFVQVVPECCSRLLCGSSASHSAGRFDPRKRFRPWTRSHDNVHSE